MWRFWCQAKREPRGAAQTRVRVRRAQFRWKPVAVLSGSGCKVTYIKVWSPPLLTYMYSATAGKAHLTAPRSTVARVRLTASVHCGVKASGSYVACELTPAAGRGPAAAPPHAFGPACTDARRTPPRCYAPYATSEPCPSPGPCRPCSYRRAAGHRTPTRTAGRARSGGSATGPGGRPRARSGSRRLAPRAETRARQSSAPRRKPSVNERGFTPSQMTQHSRRDL